MIRACHYKVTYWHRSCVWGTMDPGKYFHPGFVEAFGPYSLGLSPIVWRSPLGSNKVRHSSYRGPWHLTFTGSQVGASAPVCNFSFMFLFAAMAFELRPSFYLPIQHNLCLLFHFVSSCFFSESLLFSLIYQHILKEWCLRVQNLFNFNSRLLSWSFKRFLVQTLEQNSDGFFINPCCPFLAKIMLMKARVLLGKSELLALTQ